MRTSRLMLAALSLAIPLAVMADQPTTQNFGYKPPPRRDMDTLVELVRNGNAKNFQNPFDALGAGYKNATACVSGPNEGAMGIHLVYNPHPVPNQPPESVVDNKLEPESPEALIYEPVGNNHYRLVGVEFIQLVDFWHGEGTPRVNGQLMNYVGAPNRYGLPAFYELHVWAFGENNNPRGFFADWNTLVTCNKAKPDDLPNPP